ncbi:SDR family NAD(P)-dependent oxidoreductase [Mycobacterium camsae]|uniref:SDR family NAD(P)-dependent oxidoreductase n=1 Tax=Mycobacterium gordonae TaxID=1778 RepID=UPI00197DC64B|nr:SDR family NAD(P)-dependent oxidoreductase [Mycobacterium gordonae]
MTRQHIDIHRTVAITGGARGIGLAIGAAFARAGASVALGDLDAALAEESAAALSASTGGTAHGLPLDVTHRESFDAFLTEAESRLGPLDTLVNNAGIMPTGLLVDEDDEITDKLIAINVGGVITGCKLAIAHLSAPNARIVNIASLAGVSAHRGVATYCGTKHAVIGFSDALRRELVDKGIGVTVVLPGLVRTELSAGNSTPKWLLPVSEVDPDDVAAAVVDAVERERDRVVVPRALGAMLAVMALIPTGPRQRLERAAGLDTAFTATDVAARARYHARLRNDVR